MNERAQIELQEFILKLKEFQPQQHTKTLKTYMFELSRQFLELSDEAILEGIQVYEDNKEMYQEKPIQYFIAIVKNKQKNKDNQKNKESELNEDIPNLNL